MCFMAVVFSWSADIEDKKVAIKRWFFSNKIFVEIQYISETLINKWLNKYICNFNYNWNQICMCLFVYLVEVKNKKSQL